MSDGIRRHCNNETEQHNGSVNTSSEATQKNHKLLAVAITDPKAIQTSWWLHILLGTGV